MTYHSVIIGAGMSGLAAAIRLAHFGRKTLILDRHFREGGLNSYYEAGGYALDAGLHAMTNFNPGGSKNSPLNKLLRLLRIKPEELDLVPQRFSKISFPDATLTFSNELPRLLDDVAQKFPRQTDNLRLLIEKVRGYDDGDLTAIRESARTVVGAIITDPTLLEMIFCPLQFYGSAEEDDIDFWQFVIMFKAIFLEGMARPVAGVRRVLERLLTRIEESGAELRLGVGVDKIITEDGRATRLLLSDGSEALCDTVISSAGLCETLALCPEAGNRAMIRPGRLGYAESINILDRSAADIGEEATLIFFSKNKQFAYHKPEAPLDIESGVICFPGNFQYGEKRPDGVDMIRTTHLANYDHWLGIEGIPYMKEKAEWRKKSLAAIAAITKDFRPHIKFSDMFTPATIRKFTSHVNGVVYGTPDKRKSGRTDIENLYICGTDQGYLGIVGSMLSGVIVSNSLILDNP